METKICSKCNTEKDIEDFYKRNSKPISRCKECTKSSVSSYRANNLSVIKDRKSKYYSELDKDSYIDKLISFSCKALQLDKPKEIENNN